MTTTNWGGKSIHQSGKVEGISSRGKGGVLSCSTFNQRKISGRSEIKGVSLMNES
jgi:hypothetical protein